MENKKTSNSWLILGAVFIIILFIAAYLTKLNILDVSYGAKTWISAVFGFGGVLFLVIGLVKSIIEKFRK